jgi:ABC-type Fe3+-hydroxamate transport system substrate-binding protein
MTGGLKSFVPPLALAMFIGSMAAAVQRFASPPGGLQLPKLVSAHPAFDGRLGGLEYPRESVDSDDFQVTIKQQPQRIVSQFYSIDEFLYSLIPPQRVVAASASAYQPSVSNVVDYAKKYRPAIASDPERVLRLNPDLILVSSSARSDFTSLARNTGVPTYRLFTSFDSLDQVEKTIGLVGYLTGEDKAAHAKEEQFQAEIKEAEGMRPAEAHKPRILGLGGNYTYGSETLFNDIVEKLGGVNVGAQGGLQGYDEVNSEMIVKWDPEWIFAGANPGESEMTKAKLLANPAIAHTQAARDHHIVVVEGPVFFASSPYATSLLKIMATALYGNSLHKTSAAVNAPLRGDL